MGAERAGSYMRAKPWEPALLKEPGGIPITGDLPTPTQVQAEESEGTCRPVLHKIRPVGGIYFPIWAVAAQLFHSSYISIYYCRLPVSCWKTCPWLSYWLISLNWSLMFPNKFSNLCECRIWCNFNHLTSVHTIPVLPVSSPMSLFTSWAEPVRRHNTKPYVAQRTPCAYAVNYKPLLSTYRINLSVLSSTKW